jgi:hypothetical protein
VTDRTYPQRDTPTGGLLLGTFPIDKLPAPLTAPSGSLGRIPSKKTPRVTLTAHNLDPTTVTIPFTTQSVTATDSHSRVLLRGQNPCALANLASWSHRIQHSLRQPPAHRLSSLCSLNPHISAKSFPRQRPPHRPTNQNHPSPAALNALSALSAHIFPKFYERPGK